MAHHPIRVDNSEPATVRDAARTLGVSKKRTEELIRAVRRTLHRDLKTGNLVIRPGKASVRSRNGNSKVEKTSSARRRIAR